jgi:hypothetical protein
VENDSEKEKGDSQPKGTNARKRKEKKSVYLVGCCIVENVKKGERRKKDNNWGGVFVFNVDQSNTHKRTHTHTQTGHRNPSRMRQGRGDKITNSKDMEGGVGRGAMQRRTR